MSRIAVSQELREATDAQIEGALRHANPLALRGLLYQLTGDESLAEIPVEFVSAVGRAPSATVVDREAVALLEAKTAAFLKGLRDSGAADVDAGPKGRLALSLDLAVGESIAADEVELWIEQLALDPMVRSLAWRRQPDEARRADFHVVVIGAGMSGLNAAVQLKAAGIPFTVVEKNAGVGGTWHENRYPGARVDSPSRTYFNAFSLPFELPNAFTPQAVNERYFNWVADEFGVRGDIVFETEVKSAAWEEDKSLWEVKVVGPDGPKTLRANAVIACVGFLNRPNLPPFAGAEDFKGQSFHTSRWPEGLDVSDKRVVVIGSGATSYQMTPVLAKMAKSVTLFQRTPRWCLETPGYLKPSAPEATWLDRNVPLMVNFNRLWASWRARPDALRGVIEVDPELGFAGDVSEGNRARRDACLEFIQRKLAGRPDLIARMTPDLPPMTSRPVLVDAVDNIYDALLQDNVSLVSEPIERITAGGVRTADGVEHPADVIVYATGFRANDYLWPMDFRGRGGRSLADLWSKDGARAYLGTMMPGFPNLFSIYGPNMNPFGGGLSVTDLQEMQTRFTLKCLEHLILEDRGSVDVTFQAYETYNAELDRRQATKVYSDPRITNYYRNEFGRCSVNSGYDTRLLWRWLRDPGEPKSDNAADAFARPYFGADLVVEGR